MKTPAEIYQKSQRHYEGKRHAECLLTEQ
jgi:hypothetical protein